MLVNREVPAELVRPCPDEPALPVVFMDDREQARWISDAIDAGAECRAAHRKLAEWAQGPFGSAQGRPFGSAQGDSTK